MGNEETLTPKQALFVEHYVSSWNAAEAAREAGYPRKAARNVGYENLTKPHIQAHIKKVLDARLQQVGVRGERVLEEIARIAFADYTDFAEVKGGFLKIRDTGDLPRDKRAVIAQISEVSKEHGRDVTLKVHDKVKALELLGKHLKLFTDKVETSDTTPAGGVPPRDRQYSMEEFINAIRKWRYIDVEGAPLKRAFESSEELALGPGPQGSADSAHAQRSGTEGSAAVHDFVSGIPGHVGDPLDPSGDPIAGAPNDGRNKI